MGWLDTAKQLGDEVAKVFKELVTLQAEVRSIEKTIDRTREDQREFIGQTRQDIRDLQRDFDEIRRRLSRIEGTLDAAFERSLQAALVQLGREHIEREGSLEGFAPNILGSEALDDDNNPDGE